MTASYCYAGSLTTDNVVTADGGILPRTVGGNAAYSAMGGYLWHRRVGILSRVGSGYPDKALAALADRGIELAVTSQPDPHEMNVAFWYRPDGSRERDIPAAVWDTIPGPDRDRFVDYTTLGTANRYRVWMKFAPTPDDLPAAWLDRLSGLHLAAMPVRRQQDLAAHCRARRPDLVLTMDSPWYDDREPAVDHHSPLLPLLTAVLPSEADLRDPLPAEDPLRAAAMLVGWGARLVVVKLGAAGSLVVDHRQKAWSIPSYPTDVLDPTGAGDSFCGGFLVGLHTTGDPVRAAAMGTVSASVAIAHQGYLGMIDDPGRAGLADRLEHVLAGVREVGHLDVRRAFDRRDP